MACSESGGDGGPIQQGKDAGSGAGAEFLSGVRSSEADVDANRISGKGFRRDEVFEVTSGGAVIGAVNYTKSKFDLGGRGFVIATEGFVAPTQSLKYGEQVIATARQKPLLNSYVLTFGAREWTFKAINWTATKCGLFAGDTQAGTLSTGGFGTRLTGLPVDLPQELPQELQVFLLAIFIRSLMTSGD